MPLSVLKCPPLHIGRDGDIELLQNRWGHIHQLETKKFTSTRTLVNSRVMFDHNTELRMIAIIGSGVVIEGVNRAMAY